MFLEQHPTVHGRNLISDGSKSDKLPRENLILDGSKSDKLLRENPSSIMQTVCNYFSTYNPNIIFLTTSF